jgi:hypothetical protein
VQVENDRPRALGERAGTREGGGPGRAIGKVDVEELLADPELEDLGRGPVVDIQELGVA